MVALLVSQSFFIGIFFAALEISATSLFMDQYGEEMLGRAFLLSGLMGMILTGLFSILQSKIRYATLITINLIVITILTFIMWASFSYSESEWLVFGIFSLMGALYILSLVAFSGIAGRLFTLRQGKRLFSIIDSGLVFGMILISLAVPFLLKIVPEIKDLMLISAVGIFCSLIVQSVTASKYNLSGSKGKENDNENEKEEETESVGLIKFIANKYIRLLAFFVMLSMITLFFTSYNFLTSGKVSYPNPNDFAIFLANFTIAVMAFSFVLKTFVYSKLIKTYGLKVSLLVTPILIGILIIISAVVGSIFGYEINTASFAIFFLLLALVRFFSINLKDSIQTPSLRLLFQPLDSKIRYNVQAKVEGLVNEFSAVLSGLLLAVLGLMTFMELIHYSYILIAIIGAWIYVTLQLYKEYQNMLRRSLIDYKKKLKITTEGESADLQKIDDEGEIALQKIERSLELLRNYEPTLFDMKLDQLLKESSIKARQLAIKSIDESEIYSAVKELQKIAKEDKDESIKKLAGDVRAKLEKSYKNYLDQEKIIYLAKSKNEQDRVKAAKIIGDSANLEYSSLLKNLLKDLSPSVKLQAIHSVVKLNNKDLWPTLIELLGNEQFRSAAKSAIESIGDPIMENLERAFYKSGVEHELLIAVVDLYGKIHGEKSIKYLLKKLNDPNRQIVSRALNSLRMLNFSADNEAIQSHIFQAIEQNVGLAAWNIAAKYDIDEQGINEYLSRALEDELSDNFNMIFLLLSLIYDPRSIEHIRENIESGTTEGVSFAIEMLDLFIADQLKGFLFALLEDNRPDEKIRELELHFPINVYGNSDVLKQIMNRSANYLNNFTRACAIYSFLNLSEEEQVISNDIIANLFNNDPLLNETAAIVMQRIDPKSYNASKERLTEDQQEKLDKSISQYSNNIYTALIEKVIFLNGIDALIHKNQRLIEDLAIKLEYNKAKAGAVLIKNGEVNNYYFIISGSAVCKMENSSFKFGSNQLMNDMFFLDNDKESAVVVAGSEMTSLIIPDSELKMLLFKYPELVDIMLFTFDSRVSNRVDVS